LLALLPALLALFLALLTCLPVLLAALLALLALLALFPALLTIRGPVPVLPTTATLAIAIASGSVSAFAVPAWLVASVSPAHEFLLVVSIAQYDSVSCTRSGTGVTPAGISPYPALWVGRSFWITEAG
jgi:hypothetical protein